MRVLDDADGEIEFGDVARRFAATGTRASSRSSLQDRGVSSGGSPRAQRSHSISAPIRAARSAASVNHGESESGGRWRTWRRCPHSRWTIHSPAASRSNSRICRGIMVGFTGDMPVSFSTAAPKFSSGSRGTLLHGSASIDRKPLESSGTATGHWASARSRNASSLRFSCCTEISCRALARRSVSRAFWNTCFASSV